MALVRRKMHLRLRRARVALKFGFCLHDRLLHRSHRLHIDITIKVTDLHHLAPLWMTCIALTSLEAADESNGKKSNKVPVCQRFSFNLALQSSPAPTYDLFMTP